MKLPHLSFSQLVVRRYGKMCLLAKESSPSVQRSGFACTSTGSCINSFKCLLADLGLAPLYVSCNQCA